MKLLIGSLFFGLCLSLGLAGCATSDANVLQPTGNVTVQGEYATRMVAPDNGQVTVYDEDVDRTIWTGAIRKGSTLVIDPVNKQLLLDGLACNMQDLKTGHTLKITFDKTN